VETAARIVIGKAALIQKRDTIFQNSDNLPINAR
jgi:hypothetical protein